MGNINSIGMTIGAIVMIIVLAIVSFFLYTIIQQNADRYLAIYNDYCSIGETQLFTKAFLVDGDGEIATRAQTLTISNAAATAGTPTCEGIATAEKYTVLRDRITAGGSFAVVDQHRNPINGQTVTVSGPVAGVVTASSAADFGTARAKEPLPITEFLSNLSNNCLLYTSPSPRD